MTERDVKHSHPDPLSEVWLRAAARIGLRIARTRDAFAHGDSLGNLPIATDEYRAADNCLAQRIFELLCHSLVEGPESLARPDWDLDEGNQVAQERELATLRVQGLLAGRHGLRRVLAPTCNVRSFYDALGPDALVPTSDASTRLARPAIRRAQTNPWWPHLGNALEATATMAADRRAPSQSAELYPLLEAPVPRHGTGLFGRSAELTGNVGEGPWDECGGCAWRQEGDRCQQAEQAVAADSPACERFEPPFHCQDCGACCRAAYHSVTITPGDAIADLHPELLVHHATYSELRRADDRCAALEPRGSQFLCTIYDDRPSCCREFENAGLHCITARRRLGLSL